MPPKKNSANQPKPVPEQVAVIMEGGDPVASAISIVDKKVRNLEKRRNKLQSLKESALELGGNALDPDQQEAITKIKDVNLQLEMVKELQKQFATLQTEHQKYRKRQQRQERVQAKEAEREAETKVVAYTLRVQDMLNGFGEEDKENFRTGTEGAVKLSEEELSQIDELYKMVNPSREDNPNYETEVTQASETFVLLRESSSKEVVGTTYKGLHDVLDRIDESGYFDKPSQGDQDDQESDEDADDFKSTDEQPPALRDEVVPPGTGNFTEEVDIPPEVPPMVEAEPPTQYLGSADVMNNVAPPPPSGGMNHVLGNTAAISQASSIMNYMPPAPSPTFPALGTSPVLMMHDDGFSFMHDSEVDRKQIHSPTNAPFTTSQQITHQAPPSQVQSQLATQKADYRNQYDNRGGVVSPAVEQEMMPGSVGQADLQNTATDVTTGQPSPSIQPSYQSTVTMDATTGIMAPSAPPTSHDLGSMGVSNPGVGGAIYSSDVPSGFRQQSSQNQQYYRQNKNGRGTNHSVGSGGGHGRRPPGVQGNKSNYGNNRNGRGMQGQGGYESRGYGGGGGGGGYQQQRGGGRPNYRTSANAAAGGGGGGGGQRRS